ncbi:MAG: trypsin-like peptidase domain-containing protein [Pirellulaceae bacterium]
MVSWIITALLATAVAGQKDCTIVYFGSANCQPCQQMAPALAQLKQEGWDIRPVDASTRSDLAAQYRIDNLPTLVIVSNQREVDRIVGAVAYEQLNSRFQRAAARMQSSNNQAFAANTTGNDTRSDAQQSANIAQSEAIQPLVRGQSPTSSGFPLLAASAAPMTSAIAHAVPNISGGERREQAFSGELQTQQPQDSPASAWGSPEAHAVSSYADHANSTMVTPASAVSSSSGALNIDQAIARAAAATVRIKVEEANTTAYGTGTIVSVHGQEALILTCGHLFRDMQPGSQLSVDLFAGTPQETNVFAQLIDYKCEEEDIGLLSFTLPTRIEPVQILPRGEVLQVGQPAFSFGCDHGENPTRRDTRICNINRFLGAANVEIEGAPAVGRSGGGLFDVHGRLIGVCNAADAEDDQGIYAAADVVYTQLARIGESQLFETPAGSPTAHPSLQLAGSHSGSRQSDSFTQPAVLAQVAPATASTTPVQAASAKEVIVIVRDATGQSRVVTIPAPTPELLQAIQQHSN